MKTQIKYSAIGKLCAKALNILHRHSLNRHAHLSSGARGLKPLHLSMCATNALERLHFCAGLPEPYLLPCDEYSLRPVFWFMKNH